jgi:hypothetical protein
MLPVVLFLALAQAPVVPEPPKPAVSAEQRAQYWRAQVELMAAQTRLKAIVEQMAATCGAQPVSTPEGEPACPPKPKPQSK